GSNGYQCLQPACFTGQIQCKDLRTAQSCNLTGGWVDQTCAASQECQAGICVDECSDAVAANSYFGCDYWTAVPDNSVDKIFKANVTSGQGALSATSEFAFVVANRSANSATVSVTRFYNNVVENVTGVVVPGRSDPATKGVAVIKVP